MSDNFEQLCKRSRKRFLTFDQEGMIDWFGLRHDANTLYFHILGREARLDRETAWYVRGFLLSLLTGRKALS